ncbi:MAG TPA: PqqD family protein [Prochlorococcus sp.]|jgi:hypothetical protein
MSCEPTSAEPFTAKQETDLDGQVALFQAETYNYLLLNDTCSAIWGLFNSPRSLEEVCKQLAGDHEISLNICSHKMKHD